LLVNFSDASDAERVRFPEHMAYVAFGEWAESGGDLTPGDVLTQEPRFEGFLHHTTPH
jgi:hypothetical protein